MEREKTNMCRPPVNVPNAPKHCPRVFREHNYLPFGEIQIQHSTMNEDNQNNTHSKMKKMITSSGRKEARGEGPSRRPTFDMKRTNSSDYAALDRSLKRVKISTSPGELRLDRDFEDLQAGRSSWTSSTNNSSECPSWDRPRGRVQELCCHNGCIARDPVDPLRLRLIYVHQEPSPPQGSPVPVCH